MNKRRIKEKLLREILNEGQSFKKLIGRQGEDEEISPKIEPEAKTTKLLGNKGNLTEGQSLRLKGLHKEQKQTEKKKLSLCDTRQVLFCLKRPLGNSRKKTSYIIILTSIMIMT